MARSIGRSESNLLDSRIPNPKEKVPTIDELMGRPPPPKDWREFLPPPVPRSPDPFGPVPIIPAPIEVDPPWMFGPSHITRAPPQAPSFGWSSAQVVPPPVPFLSSASPQQASGGLPGMMA